MTSTSSHAVLDTGMTAEQVSDMTVVEALASDDSAVAGLLDPRLKGRLGMGTATSAGDLLVAGVALALSYVIADHPLPEVLRFVNGRSRAILSAAYSGQWHRTGKVFRLTAANAVELHEALVAVEAGLSQKERNQSKRADRIATRQAKERISALEKDGVDAFLLTWGTTLNSDREMRRHIETFNSARAGEWVVSGKRFFWNEYNAVLACQAAEAIDQKWQRAIEMAEAGISL